MFDTLNCVAAVPLNTCEKHQNRPISWSRRHHGSRCLAWTQRRLARSDMGFFPDSVQSSKRYLLFNSTPVYNRELQPLLLLGWMVLRDFDRVLWSWSGKSFKISSAESVFKSNYDNRYSKRIFNSIIFSCSKYEETCSSGFTRTITPSAAFCKTLMLYYEMGIEKMCNIIICHGGLTMVSVTSVRSDKRPFSNVKKWNPSRNIALKKSKGPRTEHSNFCGL